MKEGGAQNADRQDLQWKDDLLDVVGNFHNKASCPVDTLSEEVKSNQPTKDDESRLSQAV
jgi:hypothetical protein